MFVWHESTVVQLAQSTEVPFFLKSRNGRSSQYRIGYRKASPASQRLQRPKSFFLVLLSLRVRPYSAWLKLALHHLICMFQTVRQGRKENEGQEISFTENECCTHHFHWFFCGWNVTAAHVWLSERLGKVVKLCGYVPSYNLGWGILFLNEWENVYWRTISTLPQRNTV